MSVTILQVYTACRNYTAEHQSPNRPFLLCRAYYRTGQLSMEDWFVPPTAPYFFGASVYSYSPEMVEHFYQQLLPTLNQQTVLRLYLLRLYCHAREATGLILGHDPDLADIEISMKSRRATTADRGIALANEGLPPHLAEPQYMERRHHGGLDFSVNVTERVTGLPPGALLSTIGSTIGSPPVEQWLNRVVETVIPTEEIQAMGLSIWGHLKPLSENDTLTLLSPTELAIPSEGKVQSAWRKVLLDRRYLLQAFIKYKSLAGKFSKKNYDRRGLKRSMDDIGCSIQRKVEKMERKTLSIPIIREYVKYIQLLLSSAEITTLEPQQLEESDPVFHISCPPVEWNLKVDPTTQAGLSRIMSTFAGKVPTDSEILQRLATKL